MGNNPSVEYNAYGEATYTGPESGSLGAVGIVFVKDRRNELIVNLLVKGGPAHQSGNVVQGDVLRYIDNYDIRSSTTWIDPIPLLSGKEGTLVALGFERGPDALPVLVNIVRSAECFPDQLMLPPPGFDFPSRGDPEEDFVADDPFLNQGPTMQDMGVDYC